MHLMSRIKHNVFISSSKRRREENGLAERKKKANWGLAGLRYLFLEAKFSGQLVPCVPAQQGMSCAHMSFILHMSCVCWWSSAPPPAACPGMTE
jgi:hypothetical protein